MVKAAINHFWSAPNSLIAKFVITNLPINYENGHEWENGFEPSHFIHDNILHG